MGKTSRINKSVDRNDILQQIEDLLRQVAQGDVQVSVEDQGRTVAAIISEQDLARLRRYDLEVNDGAAILERMREPFRDIEPGQIEQAVATIIDDMRRGTRSASEASDRE